ncbi:hypothetical protein B0H11DRAFT_1947007 [Mycena galericulata]|nr:hypothetical protein B0H11DRAFT_1947007 [Mycena galericulata]
MPCANAVAPGVSRESRDTMASPPRSASSSPPDSTSDLLVDTPTPDSTTPVSTPAGPMTEAAWKAQLKKLDRKIRKYNWKTAHAHERTKRDEEAATIVTLMRELGASHPDPGVQAYWAQRADVFAAAPEADKKAVLKDVAKGVTLLIVAPFAVAGALVLAVGKALKLSGALMVESGRG